MTLIQRWTLVATIIGSGIVFLDGTIVNVALPRIGRDLPASILGVLEGQTYIVSGYLAVLAALLILAGALSDHYGRRRIFGIGLTLVRRDVRRVRTRADPRAAGHRPPVPGGGRRAARARLAGDHHERIRGPAAGPRLRDLGGGHLRPRGPRSDHWRRPRRFGRLARRVPRQRAAHPRRAVCPAPRRRSHATRPATGASTGSARSSPRSRSADSPSA